MSKIKGFALVLVGSMSMILLTLGNLFSCKQVSIADSKADEEHVLQEGPSPELQKQLDDQALQLLKRIQKKCSEEVIRKNSKYLENLRQLAKK